VTAGPALLIENFTNLFNHTNMEKIPLPWIVVAVLTCLLALVGIAGITIIKQESFMVYGKEFGFGSDEYKETKKALEQSILEGKKNADKLSLLEQENNLLRGKILDYKERLDAENSRINEQWFPLDEITLEEIYYNENRSVINLETRKFKGAVWYSPEKELSIRVASLKYGEALLETNLPDPYSQLRLTTVTPWMIPRDKWHYQLTLIPSRYGSSIIRIERRSPLAKK